MPNVHRNQTALLGTGEKGGRGGGGYGGGGSGRLYTYCYMGSDGSHFNVSLTVRDKVTRQCPHWDHNFWKERRAEADSNRGPSAYQPNALPLGQTGSPLHSQLHGHTSMASCIVLLRCTLRASLSGTFLQQVGYRTTVNGVWFSEWMNENLYIVHKKLPHKTLRVHSARYTQCIHVSSRKLKLPKDVHSYPPTPFQSGTMHNS